MAVMYIKNRVKFMQRYLKVWYSSYESGWSGFIQDIQDIST
ncbi:Uncharacterized protein dnl_02190 [Desulfonema limicola]|uniref:Uncharacterized protein n=1 Tax=Desulfonema limicola TaxID=45656 RepID=A0A975GE95_9BACT|nr:Uncharacterized protein dnl_02190 [Desulfonema limicola]